MFVRTHEREKGKSHLLSESGHGIRNLSDHRSSSCNTSTFLQISNLIPGYTNALCVTALPVFSPLLPDSVIEKNPSDVKHQ